MLRFSSTSFFVFDNLQIKTIYLRSLAHYLTWLQMHLSHSATWFLFSGPPPCVASSRCPWAACSPPWCHWCPSAGSCCRVTMEQCQCQVTQHLLLATASPLQPGTVLLYLHNRAATLLSYNLKAFRLLSPHVLIRILWILDIEPLIFSLPCVMLLQAPSFALLDI